MHTSLRRSVVALATALACLTLMASPVSATAHTVTVTGGTLTLQSTGTFPSILTFPFGGTVGAGCGSSVVADVVPDGTGQAGTIDLTTFSNLVHFTWGTTHYVATMTRASSTSGTWGSSAIAASLTVGINIQIRAAANNTSTNVDCATTGGVLCTWRATLHFVGSYANGPLSTTGATLSISTSGPATVTLGLGTCQIPFGTFNGGSATVAGLTGVM